MADSRSSATYYRVAAGLFVIVALVATIVATQRGPGTTPDSATYASVAENLVRTGELTTYAGGELTIFPPGLPILLAAGGLVGMEPDTTARALNAIAFAAIVVLSAMLIARAVASVPLRIVGLALVAFSPILLGVSVMLWSEPAFIVATLALLVILRRACDEEGLLFSALGGALAGAAFLIRYPGLALIGFGLVTLGWVAWRRRDRSGIGRVVVFGGVAGVPVVAWLVHNVAYGSLLGTTVASPVENRVRAGEGVVENGRDIVQTVGGWLAPQGGWIVLIAVAVVLGAAWLREGERSDQRSQVGYLAGFIAFYTAAVWIGASVTHVDPIDDRLLSPVYVPLLAVALSAVESLLRALSPRTVLKRAVATVLILWLAVPGAAWVSRLGAATEGVGFAADHWQSSPLVELASGEAGSPMFSNFPDGIYLVAGSQPLGFGPGDSAQSVARFTETVQCFGPIVYADFVYPRIGMRSTAEFGAGLALERVASVDDGSLYVVTARSAAPAGACGS